MAAKLRSMNEKVVSLDTHSTYRRRGVTHGEPVALRRQGKHMSDDQGQDQGHKDGKRPKGRSPAQSSGQYKRQQDRMRGVADTPYVAHLHAISDYVAKLVDDSGMSHGQIADWARQIAARDGVELKLTPQSVGRFAGQSGWYGKVVDDLSYRNFRYVLRALGSSFGTMEREIEHPSPEAAVEESAMLHYFRDIEQPRFRQKALDDVRDLAYLDATTPRPTPLYALPREQEGRDVTARARAELEAVNRDAQERQAAKDAEEAHAEQARKAEQEAEEKAREQDRPPEGTTGGK